MREEHKYNHNHQTDCFRYAVLHRRSTGSWLRIDFGTPISEVAAMDLVEKAYVGWELYAVCHKPTESED